MSKRVAEGEPGGSEPPAKKVQWIEMVLKQFSMYEDPDLGILTSWSEFFFTRLYKLLGDSVDNNPSNSQVKFSYKYFPFTDLR